MCSATTENIFNTFMDFLKTNAMIRRYIFLVLIISISCVSGVFPQAFDYSQKIPVDPAIRIGKLPNGLTYYIKRNLKPEKRLEIRLAVNAGSILEDTDQLGLAHFTEHMAFNGTRHFAKNELVSYLQSIGIKFGAEINAYTSFDETVYMLLLPTDNETYINKGLEVLKDWARFITFDSTEIEKERGVVIEEWRLGRGADQRMEDKYLPVLFHDSRYAVRLPIGTKETLEKFPRSAITRFYNDWYRTDMMAIVAVGDIDPEKFEKKIKEKFTDLPLNPNPRIRKTYQVPDHKETLVCVASDKEAPMTSLSVFYKANKKHEITLGNFREYAKKQLYFAMFNQRVSELTRTANPPFINAYSYYGKIGAREKEAYVSSALVSDTGVFTGLTALIQENEKARQFGFTQTELDRAKMSLKNTYEQIYNERDKTESENYAAEYIRNFLTGEPIPGIEFEYEFMKKYLPEVKLQDINELAGKLIIDSNRVVVVTAPEKAGLKVPDEKEVWSELNSISNKELHAYTDNLTDSKLLDQKPEPGKIVSSNSFSEIGVTTLTLSNGVKVILKPTDFKNDEVVLSAISSGGHSLYNDTDHFSADFADQIITECGLGKYSATDLQKLLSVKTVGVSPYINLYSEGIKGNCAPKDMETMFQLILMYFTQPRIDTVAYLSFKSRIKGYLKNLESDPQLYYKDQLIRLMTQNHPRGGGIPKESDIDKINLGRVFSIYNDRFADAGDFTFTIVGNFKIDSIKNLIECYLGSLPAVKRNENWKDLNIRPPKGNLVKNIYRGTDPKSFVVMVFTDTATYNSHDAFLLKEFSEYLDIRLIEVLREEKSGVYGVGAFAALNRIPCGQYKISIEFPCSPENVDSLTNTAYSIAEKVKEEGILKKNLKKVKETETRELELNLKINSFWLSYLENAFYFNDNPLDILKQKKNIDHLKSNDMREIAGKCIKNKYIRVVLYPKAMEK
jgi:zinc protease